MRPKHNSLSSLPDDAERFSGPPLLKRKLDWMRGRASRLPSLFRRIVSCKSLLRQCRVRLFTAAFAIWFALSSLHTPVAHASSTTAAPEPPAVERVTVAETSQVDAIIDRYVEQHMFDDDIPTAFESTFREAYDDATTKQYPSALKQIMGSEQRNLLSSNRKRDWGQIFLGAVRFIQSKTGLNEVIVLGALSFLAVIVAPFTLLVSFMTINGISKRRMEAEFRERYGDTYSVDATLKPEETIEAPDDEDDDDPSGKDDDDDDD